jgi:hypothetical protein
MALQAWAWHDRWRHEHGNDAGCTTSWDRGGRHCCGLENGVVGLGTMPVWSMAPPARVWEDGGVQRGSTIIENNSVEALRRTQRWRGGAREDSKTARTLGRSTTVRALGKFLAGNFGSLMA